MRIVVWKWRGCAEPRPAAPRIREETAGCPEGRTRCRRGQYHVAYFRLVMHFQVLVCSWGIREALELMWSPGLVCYLRVWATTSTNLSWRNTRTLPRAFARGLLRMFGFPQKTVQCSKTFLWLYDFFFLSFSLGLVCGEQRVAGSFEGSKGLWSMLTSPDLR